MNATPIICPACGELLIAWPDTDETTLVVPAHPDRVMPFVDCAASAHAMKAGKILLP